MRQLKRKKQVDGVTPNAKIKNATKLVVDGVKFDSRLEYYMYTLLQGAGVNFEFQKVYLLQEKFRYGKEAIRPITVCTDFWLPEHNLIIDTKGMQTQQGAIRYKMLKWVLFQQGLTPTIIMPKNKKECESVIEKLK